jgi:predicted lipoprotein
LRFGSVFVDMAVLLSLVLRPLSTLSGELQNGDGRLRSRFPQFAPVNMNKALPVLIVIIVLAGLCWLFPPFHIRSLKKVEAAIAGAQFNPTDFVKQFWSEKLLPATAKAAEATNVVATIAADPVKAQKEFGRSVGISSTYYFFLRGTARVVSADDNSINLSLKDEGSDVDITVPLGPVFGDAVRDGTGLLNPSHYPNAQDYNGISAALDHVVETQVLPGFQKIAKVGVKVQFTGCVEVDDPSGLKPLGGAGRRRGARLVQRLCHHPFQAAAVRGHAGHVEHRARVDDVVDRRLSHHAAR